MQAIDRILDANLDRAREGLRVIEEWCRFGLDHTEWTARCKEMRHTLAQWHNPNWVLARNTLADVGTDLTHNQEVIRRDPQHLLTANCSRVQEALRVIEEYAKLRDPQLAQVAKQLRYQVYILHSDLMAALTGASRKQRLHQAHLYLITMPIPHWLEAVEGSLAGGVRLVQYRHKDASDGQRLQDLYALRQLCTRYEALLIVNDCVDLALLVEADGVHVGQTDLPVAEVRRLLGADKIIGQSTTNPDELTAALASDVDYIGVGPVFSTPTKAGKAPAGWDYIRQVREQVSLPWFAIGGIDGDNLPEVMAAGAERVSVVRALMQAGDPCRTAQALLTQLGSRA